MTDIHTRRAPKPYMCNLILNGVPIQFEIDTGAGRTLLCARDYYKVRNEGYGTVDLESGGVTILRSYSGDIIETIGKVVLNANHNGSSQNITVIVVKSNGPNLLGRDFLNTFQIDWTNVFTMNTSDVNIFAKYPDLFKAELGMLKDVKVKINVEINHSPRFCKMRSVPYSMKEKVDTQLDKIVEQGVLIPVQYLDYASPIVSVLKQDGTVRICADYKQTVNTITSIIF